MTEIDRFPIVLAPNDPPVLVGILHAALTLDGIAVEREVYLTYERYEHIIHRREVDHADMADMVLRRLADVLENPTHRGTHDDVRQMVLYAAFPDDVSGVCVSVKCLKGESWVNTAYPLGRKSLLRDVRKGRMSLL